MHYICVCLTIALGFDSSYHIERDCVLKTLYITIVAIANILIINLFVVLASDMTSESGDGAIHGQVFGDAGQVLRGASVILVELQTITTTDAEGKFVFRGLRDGLYTVQAKHLGYASASFRVAVAEAYAEMFIILQPTHIELSEVVVQESATGMVQPEQSLSVTTANRQYLSESSSMTLMQTLQRIPGVQSMDIGTGISKPLIRGLGFNRMVTAQDNIKQQGQQWGADHGLEIDVYGIERVEVLKGPASLVYGSDAIGGALNIRPAVVPQENTTKSEFVATARSNNDLLGGSVMTALNRSGRFLRVRVSYQDYGDYRVPADEFTYNNWVMSIPGKRLKNTSGNDMGVSLTAGIRKAWGISRITASTFNQQAGFFPASHGIPNPGSLLEPGHPRRTSYPMQEVSHLRLVSNTILLMGKNRLETDIGFQQNHRRELNPPHVHGAGPLPNSNTELELKLNTLSLNLKYHHQASSIRTMIIGMSGSLQDNQRGGYNFLLPDYRQGDMGIFAISRWNIHERLFLNAGLRSDISAVTITGYEEPVWKDSQTIIGYVDRAPDLRRNYLNLAASAGASWMLNDRLNLKLNTGSSFRNPSAIELSANGIHHGSFRHELGDTTLNPEKAWQLDLAVSYTAKAFYITVSPFLNYFQNYLFLNPSGQFSPLPGAGQIYRFSQAEALHMGAEVYADWHVTHAIHTSVASEWVWAQNIDNQYALPFTPPASLLAELSYIWRFGAHSHYHAGESVQHGRAERKIPTESIKILGSVRMTAAQNRVARNEPATPGYVLVNAGIQSAIQIGNAPVELQLMVNNVFDVLYKNHLSFYRRLELPEPGRNVSLKIRMELKS